MTIECDKKDCWLGRASGVGDGCFCPWLSRALKPGALVCQPGDELRVYLVKSGAVALKRSGGPAVCELRTRGAIVGIRPFDRECEVIALTDVEVCSASLDGTRQWLRSDDTRGGALLCHALDSSEAVWVESSDGLGALLEGCGPRIADDEFARWLGRTEIHEE